MSRSRPAPRPRSLLAVTFALALAVGACDVQKGDGLTATASAAAQSNAAPPAPAAAPAQPAAPPASPAPQQPVPEAAKTEAARAILPLIQPVPSGATPTADLKGADADLATIQKVFDGLPQDFTGVSGADADRLAQQSELGVAQTGAFLTTYRDHAGVPVVQYIRGKLLYILSGRYRQGEIERLKGKKGPDIIERLKVSMGIYMAEIERLARSAHDKLPAEHAYRPRALVLAGQACSESERHEDARKTYEAFLKDFPKDTEVDQVTLALGRTLLDLGKYDDSIRVLKDGIDRFYASSQYPFFVETLRKAYHSKGDLDGLLEVCRTVDTVHPLKLGNKDLRQPDRDVLARFLSFNGFWKGYALLAKGDFAGARDAFKAHIDYVTNKEKGLETEKRQLKPEESVYRMRSQSCQTFVEEIAGLPVPVDFDLQNAWASEKKLRINDARGKVVAIVFRSIGDDRSAPFIGGLWPHVQRLADVDMVVISFRRGEENLAQQLDEQRDELARLGYEGPAGLDPDATDKSIFRRFKVNVGSATFLIANRRGELVWYQQDPRAIDVDFARAMLENVSKR